MAQRATRLTDAAIDRWVWYAGWADKFSQVSGSVANPVNGSYFNFSVPEPSGVVGVIAPEGSSLLGLVSRLAPVIVSGNCAVVLASETRPLPAVTLTEVPATSDVPGGVCEPDHRPAPRARAAPDGHMDVNALDAYGPTLPRVSRSRVATEMKRLVRPPRGGADAVDWLSPRAQSPYLIGEFVETKTVWHPIGRRAPRATRPSAALNRQRDPTGPMSMKAPPDPPIQSAELSIPFANQVCAAPSRGVSVYRMVPTVRRYSRRGCYRPRQASTSHSAPGSRLLEYPRSLLRPRVADVHAMTAGSQSSRRPGVAARSRPVPRALP